MNANPSRPAGGQRHLITGPDGSFSSYLALQWVDGKLLEPRLPAELFYNLLVSGRRPG